jgi:hypothetical protein
MAAAAPAVFAVDTTAGGMALFSVEVLEVDDVEGRDDAAGYIVTTNVSVVVARTWKVCCSLEENDDTEGTAEAVVVGQTVTRTVSVLVARTVTGSRSSDVVGGATWLIELIELAAGIGRIVVVVGGRDATAGCIDMAAGGREVVVGGTGGIDVVVGGTGGIDVVVGWTDLVVGFTDVLGT